MRAICCRLVAVLSLSPPMFALITIVPNGTTETTTITLSNDGDQATIEEGGAVETVGVEGIEMLDSNQTVINQGRILTTGENGIFLSAASNNSLVINNGTISTTADFLEGGIVNGGDDVTIINRGTISIIGAFNAFGIGSIGNDRSTIINNGTISAIGDETEGIIFSGNRCVTINSGQIVTSLGTGIVFSNASSNCMIVNSGSILSTEADGIGSPTNLTENNNIINSGTIRAPQGFAIHLQNEINHTLSLLRGSNL